MASWDPVKAASLLQNLLTVDIAASLKQHGQYSLRLIYDLRSRSCLGSHCRYCKRTVPQVLYADRCNAKHRPNSVYLSQYQPHTPVPVLFDSAEVIPVSAPTYAIVFVAAAIKCYAIHEKSPRLSAGLK